MTRDNATSRAREATGYIGAMSTPTGSSAGTGTPAAGPAPVWSLAAALLASPATFTHGLRVSLLIAAAAVALAAAAVSLLLRPASHNSAAN